MKRGKERVVLHTGQAEGTWLTPFADHHLDHRRRGWSCAVAPLSPAHARAPARSSAHHPMARSPGFLSWDLRLPIVVEHIHVGENIRWRRPTGFFEIPEEVWSP